MSTNDEWPENPDAGWLGAWAAKQPDLPFTFSLRKIRDLYAKKRAEALDGKMAKP